MKININDKLYRFCFWSDAKNRVPKASKYYPAVSSRVWQVSNGQDVQEADSGYTGLTSHQCHNDLELIKHVQQYVLLPNAIIHILTHQLYVADTTWNHNSDDFMRNQMLENMSKSSKSKHISTKKPLIKTLRSHYISYLTLNEAIVVIGIIGFLGFLISKIICIAAQISILDTIATGCDAIFLICFILLVCLAPYTLKCLHS